jgi:DNA gyrase subunit A
MRTRADEISVLGRSTQGVRVVDINPGEHVAGLSVEEIGEEEERSEQILLSMDGE